MASRPVLPPFDADRLAAVCSELRVRLLVLFGSRATGTPAPGPDSDLDLAVWRGPGSDGLGAWEYVRALSPIFPDHLVDVVVLPGEDALLRWEAMRTGILLWGDPDAFAELRSYAYRDFVDSADLRELEHVLFEKKMAWIRSHLRASA